MQNQNCPSKINCTGCQDGSVEVAFEIYLSIFHHAEVASVEYEADQ